VLVSYGVVTVGVGWVLQNANFAGSIQIKIMIRHLATLTMADSYAKELENYACARKLNLQNQLLAVS
jgi:hypothetical protein